MTYYSAAASVVGNRHRYFEDPDCLKTKPAELCFKDPATGKFYEQRSISGASGHGYTQVNVAWLDRSVAVLDIRSYTISGVNGPPTILTLSGVVGVPGAGADFWLNPQVLAAIPNSRSPALTVLRMTYPKDGRQYNVIRFQGGSEAWNFDLNSGALLHSSAAGEGPPIAGPVAAGETNKGSTFLSLNDLVDVHATNLPWPSAPAPAWVAQVRSLRYDGTITVYIPGNPPVSIPITSTLQRTGGGSNWAVFHQTVVQPGPTGVPSTAEADRVFGPAVIGGLWIAPEALRQLRAGQVVDTDPVTRVTVSVGQITTTAQGRSAISISETGAAQTIEYQYDLTSGMILSVSSLNRTTAQRVDLHLVGWQ